MMSRDTTDGAARAIMLACFGRVVTEVNAVNSSIGLNFGAIIQVW